VTNTLKVYNGIEFTESYTLGLFLKNNRQGLNGFRLQSKLPGHFRFSESRLRGDKIISEYAIAFCYSHHLSL